MAKEGFGAAKTHAQMAESKRHSNPGGERADGLVFTHFSPGEFKHRARYVGVNGHLACHVCGAEV